MRLDHVAEGTLNVNKSGHGLQAITWWKQGEIEKIRQYCLDDVKITKKLYEYALKNNKLKYKDAGRKIDIPIDTKGWEEVSESSLTHTLPF
jgi:DEAD/DEAH box helicase domain-containing protein